MYVVRGRLSQHSDSRVKSQMTTEQRRCRELATQRHKQAPRSTASIRMFTVHCRGSQKHHTQCYACRTRLAELLSDADIHTHRFVKIERPHARGMIAARSHHLSQPHLLRHRRKSRLSILHVLLLNCFTSKRVRTYVPGSCRVATDRRKVSNTMTMPWFLHRSKYNSALLVNT